MKLAEMHFDAIEIFSLNPALLCVLRKCLLLLPQYCPLVHMEANLILEDIEIYFLFSNHSSILDLVQVEQ